MSANNLKLRGIMIPEGMKPSIGGPYISKTKQAVFYTIYGTPYFLAKNEILKIIQLRRGSNSENKIKEYLQTIKKEKSPGATRVNSARAASAAAARNASAAAAARNANAPPPLAPRAAAAARNASAAAAASDEAAAAAELAAALAAHHAAEAKYRAEVAAAAAPQGTNYIDNLTGRLSDLTIKPTPLLNDMEKHIIKTYNPGDNDIMDYTVNKNVADFFIEGTPTALLKDKPIDAYKNSLGLEDFAVVTNNGGGNNDCLVISFLMGISPAYRRLSYPDKYKMARDFRMNRFVGLIEADPRSNELRNSVKQYIKSTRMLDDSVIPFLAHLFKINILQLEKYKEGRMEGYRELQIQPPSAALVTNPKYASEGHYPSGIIIINIGNFHYEIVRQNPKKYVFSYDELNNLYNKVNTSPLISYAPEGGVSLGFRDGNIVYVKGKGNTPFTVRDRRFKNRTQNIEYYNLTNGSRVGPNNLADIPFVNGAVIPPWNCSHCTFSNPEGSTICGACDNPRGRAGGRRRTRRSRKTKRRHR